jgi:hypothetical protein
MLLPLLRRACLLPLLLLAGCSVVHEVTIDAISDRTKPLGASYHLEVNDPSGGVERETQELAVHTIKDALAARGLYEAPPGVQPDMVIEARYERGPGHIKIVTERNTDVLLGPGITPPPNSRAVVVFDKTLELTGRAPGAPGSNKAGAELWSVKTRIVDTKQDLASYLPSLASAAIDYIGENPGRELTVPLEASQAAGLLQRRPGATAAPVPVPQNR